MQTGIGSSQRNMPDEIRAEPTPEPEAGRELMQALIAGGMPTDEVANAVANAVINDEFWILTHPESKAAITARAEEIVTGGTPGPLFAG